MSGRLIGEPVDSRECFFGKNAAALRDVEFAPAAGWKIAKWEFANTHPHEAEGGMTDGGGHPADLAIFPLGELERDPGVRHVLPVTDRRSARRHGRSGVQQSRAAGPRAKITEVDPAALEAAQRLRIRHPFDLRPILAPVRVTWVEESGVETGFVAQQQQPLGVGVEAAEWIEALGQSELGERAPA